MVTERKAIKDVLDICHDSVEGYNHAAEHVKNQEFKTIFHRLAQQRRLFIEELKNDMRDQGAELEDRETIKGFLHKNWVDLKSSFAEKTDATIIDEARKAEKQALEVYDEALAAKIPVYIKERLQQQRKLIAGAIVQLNEFEREAAE